MNLIHPRKVQIDAWGELLWDCFEEVSVLGGAAANFSYHIAQLAGDVALHSRVGQDELGLEAIRCLNDLGVNTRYIQIDPDAPTGSVQIKLVNGEPHYQIRNRVSWERISCNPITQERLKTSSLFYFGTLAQRTTIGRSHHASALDSLRKETIRFCDLNIRGDILSSEDGLETIRSSLRMAQVLKLNQHELDALSKIDDCVYRPRKLAERYNIETVILTKGGSGAESFNTQEGETSVGAAQLSYLDGDFVGAGDSFAACISMGVMMRIPLRVILPFAAEFAAWVSSHRGAMIPMNEELKNQWEKMSSPGKIA